MQQYFASGSTTLLLLFSLQLAIKSLKKSESRWWKAVVLYPVVYNPNVVPHRVID
jgi:hypothetical protein